MTASLAATSDTPALTKANLTNLTNLTNLYTHEYGIMLEGDPQATHITVCRRVADDLLPFFASLARRRGSSHSYRVVYRMIGTVDWEDAP